MKSLLIRNARVIDPSQNLDETMDIFIQDDVIQEVGRHLSTNVDKIVEAHGLVAAPGFVDMHVHLRDPGFTQKEDLYSGCRAAAAGGVTSLLCMPNTNPAIDSPEVVIDLLKRAQQTDARVYVAGCITENLQSKELCDLKALREAGAIALSDDGRPVENTALLAEAMRMAPPLGMKVVAHCEDLFLARGGRMNEGQVSKKLGIPGIPAAAEDAGTAREIALAAAYQVPIHICHVSTATSAALIRDAKRRGVQVTAETAPHYLLLTEEALEKRDADYRMNPPLRTEKDRMAMLEGLKDGTLDAIATDHAPHTPEEKSDFLRAPNGSIGMETSFAASYTALVKTGILTLPELVAKMSWNPAKILGIPAGTLRKGAHADVVLLDEKEKWVVDPNALHGKSRNTPFKGMELTGKVKYTICRGKIVYQDCM